MRTLEYGKEHEKTLLFLPCTAEPEWAFADSVGLLSQDYHVIQIVYDGHGETGEDFISVETTVDEVTDWLQARGITHLNAAYGCSLGGACLTRLLALGKIPVEPLNARLDKDSRSNWSKYRICFIIHILSFAVGRAFLLPS